MGYSEFWATRSSDTMIPPLVKEQRMITILGAGGAIGNEIAKDLTARNRRIRLVSRNPKASSGAVETLAADLSQLDDTVRAVSGSNVAFLLVGLNEAELANAIQYPIDSPGSAQ
jgi:uncharacterized protein YbjT (DUF2867 family)